MFPPPIGMQLSASSSSSQTGHLIALLQILRWPDVDLPEPGSGVREGRIILIRVGVSDWPRVSHFTFCNEESILTTQCSFSCMVQWRNGIRLTILFTPKASHHLMFDSGVCTFRSQCFWRECAIFGRELFKQLYHTFDMVSLTPGRIENNTQ